MINFAPIWLFAILPLVVNAAPAVGYFRRQTEEYHMYFFVTEDQTAWRFVFNAYRLDVSPETPEVYYNPTGFLEELSLTEVTDNVYSIGYPPEVLDEWYFNIAWMLYRARQVDSRAGSPPGGIQPGDLVTLNQTSGDTYTMNFRGETIEFLRITVALDDLEPGYFEYKGPVAPHLKLSVYVRYDGGSRSLGSVGILVACDGRPTSRFHFRLVPDASDGPYLRYNAEAAGRGTFDQLLQMVKQVCPTKLLKPGDLTSVVIASDRTIYVPFEGGRIALTRV